MDKNVVCFESYKNKKNEPNGIDEGIDFVKPQETSTDENPYIFSETWTIHAGELKTWIEFLGKIKEYYGTSLAELEKRKVDNIKEEQLNTYTGLLKEQLSIEHTILANWGEFLVSAVQTDEYRVAIENLEKQEKEGEISSSICLHLPVTGIDVMCFIKWFRMIISRENNIDQSGEWILFASLNLTLLLQMIMQHNLSESELIEKMNEFLYGETLEEWKKLNFMTTSGKFEWGLFY